MLNAIRMAIMAGTYTTVVRDPVTYYGACGCVHNEPDKALDPTDFDIGLVSYKVESLYRNRIDPQRLYAECCGFTVLVTIWIRNGNVIEILGTCDVLRRERPRFTCMVRHKDIIYALFFVNLRE